MAITDRLLRIGSLMLSAFATLAIIASVASVSNIAGPAVPGGGAADTRVVDLAQERAQPRTTETARQTEADRTRSVTPAVATAQAARAGSEWLEALTYAVLALAILMAAGLVVLIRIAAILARIAGR